MDITKFDDMLAALSSFSSMCRVQIALIGLIEELKVLGVKQEQIDIYYQYTVENPIDFKSTLKNILETLKYLRIAAQIEEIEFNAQEAFDKAVNDLKEYFIIYTHTHM